MAVLNSTLRLSLLDQVSSRAKHISGVLGGLQRQTRIMTSPLRSMSGQVLAFGATYLGVTQGISGTYGAAADAQAALSEIGIKADLSATQLGQLQQQLTSLAPKVNQTTSELLAGVDAMLTMGASADDARGSIPAIGKTATATGAAIADLSAASVAAMQNLKVMPTEIQRMLEGMTSAGNAGAFEMRDMATYFPQLSASVQSLGMQGVGAVNDLAAALQIARRGAGDASTAANNLANFTGKLMAPETIKNFRKFGVDVTKELQKAHKKGISPIEHFVKLIDEKTDGGKADLLGQLFGDKQVLDFVRPMLADFRDYLKIREDANRANGVVAEAYARRMEDAHQKTKSVSIAIGNLGTSIGKNLLGPVGEAADYLSNVFNTLGERVTIFDRIRIAGEGFRNGLGFDGNGLSDFAKEWRDFIFGVEDGSSAADKAGRIFKQFREYGDDVRHLTDAIADNPLAKLLKDVAPYGLQLFAVSAGIGLLAGTVRALAKAMWLLSGASAAVSIIKAIGGLTGLTGVKPPVVPPGGKPGAAPVAAGSPWLRTLGTFGAGLLGFGVSQTLGLGSRGTPEQEADIARRMEEQAAGYRASNYTNATIGQSTTAATIAQLAIDAANAVRSMGLGGSTTDTLPGKTMDDVGVMRIDSSSIAQMIQPSGVQQVQEVNRAPPTVNLTVNQTITGVSDPKAAGAAAVNQIGQVTKSAVDGSLRGGPY